MQRHSNAVVRTERDERLGDNGMFADKPELESLRKRADCDGRLEHRKTLADAAPRPVSKREIRARGEPACQAVEPSFGAEAGWIIIVARIAVHHPLRHQHRRTGWKIVVSNSRGLDRGARGDIR